MRATIIQATVYIKSFEGENFCGFCEFLLTANVYHWKFSLNIGGIHKLHKAWYHLVLSSQLQKFSLHIKL